MAHASPDYSITTSGNLTAAEAAQICDLIARVAEHDGANPLSEHARLHLRATAGHAATHVIATRRGPTAGPIVGYAHLDLDDLAAGASAELAVEPAERGHGLGRRLVEEVLHHSPDGRLQLWAHGERSATAEWAATLGFDHARILWQMRRSLIEPLPAPELPRDVQVVPFAVGADEDAWLELNAVAFADLPDQGNWTRADLQLRLGEPWFAAEGFLVAWHAERMVGFHWTKVHGGKSGGGDSGHGSSHAPIGEVYVVGVHPSMRGTGLGRALTIMGLEHLRAGGLTQAMLYVDSSNTSAIGLYESLDFVRWDTDVLFRRVR